VLGHICIFIFFVQTGSALDRGGAAVKELVRTDPLLAQAAAAMVELG